MTSVSRPRGSSLASRIATTVAASAVAAATALAPAALAPTAAAAVPDAADARAVVASWYRQFLGRSASADPGSRYWSDRLRSAPADQVLASLLATPEHVERQVGQYYESYLGRAVDGGASYWASGVERGAFPLEWVEQNVLASGEFVATSSSGGAGASGAVQGWYATILGRLGEPGEVGYWAGRLRVAPPLQVVREIWYTSEAVDARVADHYELYLGRSGGPGELAYWVPRERASDDAVVLAFASSGEYLEDPPDAG